MTRSNGVIASGIIFVAVGTVVLLISADFYGLDVSAQAPVHRTTSASVAINNLTAQITGVENKISYGQFMALDVDPPQRGDFVAVIR